MIQRVLIHYHLPMLACVGLILFIIVFLAAFVWVFREGSREFYSGIEQFPLQDLESHVHLKSRERE